MKSVNEKKKGGPDGIESAFFLRLPNEGMNDPSHPKKWEGSEEERKL